MSPWRANVATLLVTGYVVALATHALPQDALVAIGLVLTVAALGWSAITGGLRDAEEASAAAEEARQRAERIDELREREIAALESIAASQMNRVEQEHWRR